VRTANISEAESIRNIQCTADILKHTVTYSNATKGNWASFGKTNHRQLVV